MSFSLTSKDYVEYIKRAYIKIHESGDYITELDAATGDGDHWANINNGFGALNDMADTLETLDLTELFKQIGKSLMSVIGGSSGVLYGSAYLAAAKTVKGKETIDSQCLCDILAAMLDAMLSRGNVQPGMKTMIDVLYPTVECYKKCLADGVSEADTVDKVYKAAADGAESTKDMAAVKGRASYQTDKGVGHLDPGAMTMSYQIETLMDCVKEKL